MSSIRSVSRTESACLLLSVGATIRQLCGEGEQTTERGRTAGKLAHSGEVAHVILVDLGFDAVMFFPPRV